MGEILSVLQAIYSPRALNVLNGRKPVDWAVLTTHGAIKLEIFTLLCFISASDISVSQLEFNLNQNTSYNYPQCYSHTVSLYISKLHILLSFPNQYRCNTNMPLQVTNWKIVQTHHMTSCSYISSERWWGSLFVLEETNKSHK